MSDRQEVYQLLEDKMLKYGDLVDVPVEPNGEPMVAIQQTDNLLVAPLDPKMAEFTGSDIYVRQGVAERLGTVSLLLAETDPELQLQVVYGHRDKSIQIARFDMHIDLLKEQYEGLELIEAVHRMVAHPEVAGHPTGGAVDVLIAKAGIPLEFGTPIYKFVPDAYTFSPYVSTEAWRNRQLLRRTMVQADFTPFDGEYWHFSYGDREWARAYGKPAALYEQIDFKAEQPATLIAQNNL